jgi:starch synthase
MPEENEKPKKTTRKRKTPTQPPDASSVSPTEAAPQAQRKPAARRTARADKAAKNVDNATKVDKKDTSEKIGTRREPRPRRTAGVAADAPPAPAPVAERARGTTTPTFPVERDGPRRESLSILMVTPEAHPWAKTGGLAEVAGALPLALARLGHQVTIVLPQYRGVDVSGATRIDTGIPTGAGPQAVTFYEQRVADGITRVAVDVSGLFDREGLYGTADGDYADNGWRFALFSRAALEYARAKRVRPSIIHAHDWQTGLVPVFQKMQLSPDPYVGGVPAVFTIHNLAFQGIFDASTLPALGLTWDVMHVQAMEYWGRISYLKGGINFSERITTVSPTYAREITTPELGFGMDGVLRRRADDLVGILNGIDVTRWTPESDPFVPASFSAADPSGKGRAKTALLEAARLPADPDAQARPLIGIVSRLTDQKGFDLVAAAAAELMALDATWVMLGSGERRYEDLWRSLASRYPARVSATIGFDERLAHLIEAGADMFLMPSRFEPCGLNQMYSLRYGTVPVVRATGGLADTVQDYSPDSGSGTGFTFGEYSPGALLQAVSRALAVFRNRSAWALIQRAGMELDHSWDASAAEYVKVYESLVKAGRPRI